MTLNETFDSELELVWSGSLDAATWEALVYRTDPYKGVLKVVRMSPGGQVEVGTVVLEEEVSLSYDALFGPDSADIWDWQTKAIEAVDAL